MKIIESNDNIIVCAKNGHLCIFSRVITTVREANQAIIDYVFNFKNEDVDKLKIYNVDFGKNDSIFGVIYDNKKISKEEFQEIEEDEWHIKRYYEVAQKLYFEDTMDKFIEINKKFFERVNNFNKEKHKILYNSYYDYRKNANCVI